MAAIRLELRLVSPTCMGQRPTALGQLASTLGYLSGRVLRGALAGAFLAGRHLTELSAVSAAQFRACFQDPAVRFGHATPLPARGQAWVVPQTAWTYKRRPGWRSDDEASGVVNVLPTLLQLQRSGDLALADSLNDLDRLGQEFAREDGRRWSDCSARRRLIARTAITPIAATEAAAAAAESPPSRGVVASGQLYSLEALEPGQTFAGVIDGPDGVIGILRDLAAGVAGDPTTTLSVGQGRSRGLGQVLVADVSDVRARERDLAQCREQAEAFTRAAGGDGATVLLPVTLAADALLRDRFLLACASGDPRETLGRYRRDVPAAMSLAAAFQSTRWIGGWDELRRLPRRPQLAVAQGSVWVYTVPRAEADRAIAWWLDVERRGIGDRRNEGYGQVNLLHPLHLEGDIL